MARKGSTSKNTAAVGDPNDPEGFHPWVRRYLTALGSKGYSSRTLGNHEHALRAFIAWAGQRSITRPNQVTRPILERYQRALFYHRKDDGKPLAFGTQQSLLVPLRVFFRWLTRQGILLANPASELELPRLGRRLPRHVLTVHEVEQVLAQPDVKEVLGLRDRAMLEVLYSTGIRRLELQRLSVYDLDVDRGTVMIREGKGKKDRVVPIGERAIQWVDRYVQDARPQLVVPPDEGIMFVTTMGEMFSPTRLTQVVRGYIVDAGVGKVGSCHLLRHTMATLLLEGGCDIRHIQAILGHSDLASTQVYTQVSIRQLKAAHEAAHPACRPRDWQEREGRSEAVPDAGNDALLAALDEEDDEGDFQAAVAIEGRGE